MPTKMCDVCKRLHDIPKRDWKQLDKDGPFVCSQFCVQSWVEDHSREDFDPMTATWRGGRLLQVNLGRPDVTYSNFLHMWFRSYWEQCFAEHMAREGFKFWYERVGFEWGTKTYTPEFYFYENGCFCETKGLWQPSNRSKYKSFRKQFPDIPLMVVPWLLREEYETECKLRLV